MKWDLDSSTTWAKSCELLSQGWEPFAVTVQPDGDGGQETCIWFRRKVEEKKK